MVFKRSVLGMFPSLTACLPGACERSDLDLRSLVLQPDFTFLNSRELFLSKTASCDQPMHGVKLLKARKELGVPLFRLKGLCACAALCCMRVVDSYAG